VGGNSVSQRTGRHWPWLVQALGFSGAAFGTVFIVSVVHVKNPHGADIWLGVILVASVLLLPTLAVVTSDNFLSAPLVLVSAVAGLCVGDFFPYAMNWWSLDVDNYNSSSDAPGIRSLWFRLLFFGFYATMLGFALGFIEWVVIRFIRGFLRGRCVAQ